MDEEDLRNFDFLEIENLEEAQNLGLELGPVLLEQDVIPVADVQPEVYVPVELDLESLKPGHVFKKIIKHFRYVNLMAFLDEAKLLSLDTVNEVDASHFIAQWESLRLNIKKCTFGIGEITYLGHIVDKNGIDPKRNQGIVDMAPSQDLKGIQRFSRHDKSISFLHSRLCDRS
jgi:hypothetical protein